MRVDDTTESLFAAWGRLLSSLPRRLRYRVAMPNVPSTSTKPIMRLSEGIAERPVATGFGAGRAANQLGVLPGATTAGVGAGAGAGASATTSAAASSAVGGPMGASGSANVG